MIQHYNRFDIIIISMLKKICCIDMDMCSCQVSRLSRCQNIKIAYLTFIIFCLLILGINWVYYLNQIDFYHRFEIISVVLGTLLFLPLTLIHLIIMIVLIFRKQNAKMLNQGLWLIKILFFLLLFGVLFLFKNYLMSFQMISIWATIFLYIFQNLVYVDIVFSLNNILDQLIQQLPKIRIVKVCISVMLLISCVNLNIVLYFYQQIPTLGIITTVVMLITFLILIFRVNKYNSLLIWSLVIMLLNIQAYSVDSMNSSLSFEITLILIRLFILLILFSGMHFDSSNQIKTCKSSVNEILALNTSAFDRDNRYFASNKWIIYHAVMAIICISLPTYFIPESQQQINQFMINIAHLIAYISLIIIYLWAILSHKFCVPTYNHDLDNYFKQFELN